MEASTSSSSARRSIASDTTSERAYRSELLRAVEPYVIFKREHVRRALWLLPQLEPRRLNVQEFLRVAREVDAFATLNYSKTKRISAADVEQHLRSMGVLTPVTTSLAMLDQRDGFPVIRQSMNP
jgi:hypothetical protein